MPEPARGAEPTTPETRRLLEKNERAMHYIREKVNELLKVIGTSPLRAEELDDETLIALDPIGIVAGSFRQVLSHLKRTNAQLQLAREELQAIFDNAGLGILVIDRDQRILACNAKFREQFATGAEDLVGRSCREVVCKTDRPDRPCPFVETLRTGETYRSPDWIVGGRHYDIVETAVLNQEGAITGSVLVYSDITERILAGEELRRSQERYRDLFENTSDLILSARPDGSLEYVNSAWCTTLGYGREEAGNINLLDLLHPGCDAPCREHLQALLRGEGGGQVRTVLTAKDGRMVVFEGDVSLVREHGLPVGFRAILRDVTKRESLEEDLRRREKLESVGLLAGGIAHDFNNILTAVLGNINLAQAVSDPRDPVQARLVEAEKATLAARGLTQQLLTFSKGGLPVKRLVSVAQLVQDQTVFACRGSNVFCQVKSDPALWDTEADEGQIGQVVNNLVLNAVQAMAGGGTVLVSAENVFEGEAEDPMLPRERFVRIRVTDSGCGIERENLQRMFDPYFTTKPGGSGLGLAVSYSIVRQHGGHIRVDSEVGKGTIFSVYLPASQRKLTPAKTPARPSQPGYGRVLVMDDEAMVREIATAMIRELGYEVESAEDGEEAIVLYEQARAQDRPFSAVIMDITIPGGMGGKEAIRKLLALDPEVRALVSSGYSNDPVMADFAEHGFCAVIPKPYRLADLAAALKTATSGSPAAQ
ncbi:MAG: hybrid sensor histidine kinase/response regulator [Candidatus Geothermincolia bacterium]